MRSLVRVVTSCSVALLFLAITSCGTSEANGTVVRVRPEAAVAMINEGGYAVLDLRTRGEFDAAHVAGALNLDASARDFEERVAALDRGVGYLVYAREKAQSGQAAETMVDEGMDRVVDAGAFGLLAIAGVTLE